MIYTKETSQKDFPDEIREEIKIEEAGNVTEEDRSKFLQFLELTAIKKQKV